MRTPRACGSFAQHSGDFVLIFLCGLMMMMTRKLKAAETVRRATTEAKHIAVKAFPKASTAWRRDSGREFQRQWPVAGATHILAELFLVRCEDANAASSAQEGPLLRVRGGLDGRGVIAQIARSARHAVARTQGLQ